MKLVSALRPLRIALITLATLVTAAALFTAEENWRGRRAWAAEESRLKAKGESLDPADYFPKPVPDARNFMADPLIRAVATEGPGTNPMLDRYQHFKDDEKTWPFWKDRSIPMGSRMNFTALGKEWAAKETVHFSGGRDVAEHVLGKYAPIEEDVLRLRTAAAGMPFAQVSDPHFPSVGNLFGFSQMMGLRCAAELELGRSDDAFADQRIMIRLVEALHLSPTLLRTMIQEAVISEYILPVFWQGWDRQCWTDGQLEIYRRFFLENDPRADLPRSLLAERAYFSPAYTERSAFGSFGQAKLLGVYLQIIPEGWFYQARTEASRNVDALFLDLDLGPGRFDLAGAEAELARNRIDGKPYFFLSSMVKSVKTETLRALISISQMPRANDIGAMTSALERYRIRTGAYPVSLIELVPDLLNRIPVSPITNEPPTYVRIDAAHFQLSSTRWKEGAISPEWIWRDRTIP